MLIFKRKNKTYEIQKLKQELMERKTKNGRTRYISRNISRKTASSNNSTSQFSTKLISDEITSQINAKTGKIFEHNIRKMMENEYHCKNASMPREFFYRKIIYRDEYYILTSFNSVIINVENTKYHFEMDTHNIIQYYRNNNRNKKYTVEDKDISIKGVINIEKSTKIEVDGIYSTKGLKYPIFNNDEVSIIYNFMDNNNSENSSNDFSMVDNNKNKRAHSQQKEDIDIIIESEDNSNNNDYDTYNGVDNENIFKDYQYIVLEVKLSKKRIMELLEQIKRDCQIIPKILKQKILFIGFLNDKAIDIDISNHIEDVPFILFGINNSILCGRNVTQYLDWKTIIDLKRIDKVEERLENVEKRLDNVEKRLDNVEKRLDNVEKRLDNVEKRLDNVEKRLGGIEGRLDDIESAIKYLGDSFYNLVDSLGNNNRRRNIKKFNFNKNRKRRRGRKTPIKNANKK